MSKKAKPAKQQPWLPPQVESPAETALQKEQTDLLRQQRATIEESQRMQDLLSPLLYKSAGIKPITAGERLSKAKSDLEAARASTAAGSQEWAASLEKDIAALEANPEDPDSIVGFSDVPQDAAAVDPEAARIEQLFQERTLAALEGKLPQDPALLSELDKQEKALREQLFKQLGPGFETSTPGQDALSRFQKTKAELLSAASQADLSLAETLGISRQEASLRQAQFGQNKIGDFMARVGGVGSMGQNIAQLFGQNAGGYGNVLAGLQQNRQMVNQMGMFNTEQRNRMNMFNAGLAGGGGGGDMAGGIIGGGLQGASAGAMFGPWGAAIGGVAGMAMGGLSSKKK